MAQRISDKPFRILPLDGGGTFALIQAKTLAHLYPGQSGHEVLSHFDLVSACSGGSIVAAALAENLSPLEILRLFDEARNRRTLFGELPLNRRKIRLLMSLIGQQFGGQFSTEGKLRFLNRILPNFGSVPLHEIPAKLREQRHQLRRSRGEPLNDLALLIIAFDYDRDRARMLRSLYNSPSGNFPREPHDCTLAQAAHASSTAPVNWFDKPAVFEHGRYWDGAMTGYNNPVLIGVMEALAMGVPATDIGVLSIGTSSVSLPPEGEPGIDPDLCSQRPSPSFLGDVAKVGRIIADPPDTHCYIAHLALGGRVPETARQCPLGATSIVRFNPVVQPVLHAEQDSWRWGLPRGWDFETFHRIVELDIATTHDHDVELIHRLCDDWMAGRIHNQPVREGGTYNPATLTHPSQLCEIGHRWFADARKAWSECPSLAS